MADQMDYSILNSTKKLLGLDESYTAFDTDIIMFINSSLSTLREIGIGPVGGFMITGTNETWDDFIGGDERKVAVATYVYLRVRLLFDPPDSAFAMTAMKEQVQEHLWRLSTVREGDEWSAPA